MARRKAPRDLRRDDVIPQTVENQRGLAEIRRILILDGIFYELIAQRAI